MTVAKNKKITILTQRPNWHTLWQARTIGGHYAVTRSLLMGLDALGVEYCYNPPFSWQITATVWVLAGPDTLRHAIALKKRGKIDFLGAGPNISVLPSWDDHVIADLAVDVFAVNSEWTYAAYLADSPSLENRLIIWPAGVNETLWEPEEDCKREYVLVYIKTDGTPESAVFDYLNSKYVPFRVIKYGEYSKELYRQLLSKASSMVVLNHGESQGIALAEAWAMDVPTFCWNPGFMLCSGHRFEKVSSAPYLTETTGMFWLTIQELEGCFAALHGRNAFSPRAWLLENMTDVICAKKFIAHVRCPA